MGLGPRPRSLPIAPLAEPVRRRLPLAGPSREADKVRPIYAVWELTLRCDLSCRHCGSRAGRARPDELDTVEALDLVRQMAELEVTEVILIGGEAYLRNDWLDIAREVVRRGMECNMTTGGRGMTRERAWAAKGAGIRNVSVSLDGLEATHDALRGVPGAYRSALEALRNLKEVGIAVTANTQIGRQNLAEIPAVFEVLAAHGIHTWQVQLTVAMGRVADEPEQLLLEPYQVLEVLPMLARLKRRGDTLGVRLFAGNNIGYFGPHEGVLRGSYPLGHMFSCGAGRSTLGIEANGDIKGCPSLPSKDWVGGNVRDYTLQQIWEQSAPLRYTRDRTAEDLWGFCRSCYYADDCRAGCTWTAHTLFGRPGNNPYCHHRALELLKRGLRERVVKRREASGQPFDFGQFELIVEPWPADELDRARARHAVDLGIKPPARLSAPMDPTIELP
jgi:radical SAM protein with 4Fe4S-binding SPASM domain